MTRSVSVSLQAVRFPGLLDRPGLRSPDLKENRSLAERYHAERGFELLMPRRRRDESRTASADDCGGSE